MVTPKRLRKCCPFIDGRKDTLVAAIKKVNELTVFLVAVFVLIEFRGQPYGCSNSLKNNCLDQFLAAGGVPESDRFFMECFFERNLCYREMVRDRAFHPDVYRALPPLVESTYRPYVNYCLCL